MRTLEELEDSTSSDTEITLGMRSILGIFFGLALVCGVFFGFGYSLGRGNPARTPAPVQMAAPTPDSETEAPVPVKTIVEQPSASTNDASPRKPSGAIAEPPSASTASTEPQPAPTPAPAPEQVSEAPKAIAPAPRPPVGIPNTTSAAEPSASIPSAPIMVQIAAVSRPQDADVLVSALGKLGYHASARTSPTDDLLHVQIGPFATRDEAKAARTKLLNDGYNAIIK